MKIETPSCKPLITDDELYTMILNLDTRGTGTNPVCQNFDWDDPIECLGAVIWNGLNLQFVKRQLKFICEEAVSNNGLALKYVKNKTEDLCLSAVQNDGLALEFVPKQKQTFDVCVAALRNDPTSFRFLHDQYGDELKYLEIAMETYPPNIRFVKDLKPDLCEYLIGKYPDIILELYKPAPELCLFAIRKDLKLIGSVHFDTLVDGPIKDELHQHLAIAMITYGDKLINSGGKWFIRPFVHDEGLGNPDFR
jgi:hypothetical protein